MTKRAWSVLAVIALALVLTVLLPAATCGLLALVVRSAPGSSEYEAVSPRERAEMDRARRDVYPDDVRRDLESHRVEVAWAGLLREAVFRGAPEHDMTLTIEHHYFDWIDDHSARPEHFLLSPRGEGLVRCSWPVDPSWDLDAMRAVSPPGTMIVVYGTPERVDGAIVDLGRAAYVRSIPAEVATTTVLDYGRD